MKWIRVLGLMMPAWLLLFGGTVAMAQLPGDLDGDGEVNLADLAAFVGCMNGPDGAGVDPVCEPGNFDPVPDPDPDTDIDLRDFAGFQARFGFGQGPPRIVSFTPAPGEWVVNDIGLMEVTVGFSEPVVIPDEAVPADDGVDVWLVGGGTVEGFTMSYDAATFVLTISFAQPLRDDRVTVVIDYTIEDVAGNPLDGEILDPLSAALPSGNGINGGQGVFRIHVLQGDANRDGAVDTADLILINDSYDFCIGNIHFDPNADLNGDGCVDATDNFIVTAAFGNELPATDGVPPTALEVSSNGTSSGFDRLRVDFSETILDVTVNKQTCFLVDVNGTVSVPLFSAPSVAGDSVDYFFASTVTGCHAVNISNALGDISGEQLAVAGPLECP